MIAEQLYVPPNSREAEMSALGASILSNKAALIVTSTLQADDFYYPAHKEIFLAIKHLVSTNSPVDLVSLKHELDRRMKLEHVGGIVYVAEVCEATPSAANAGYYAGVVAEKSSRRKQIELGRKMMDGAHNPDVSAKDSLVGAATMLRGLIGESTVGLSAKLSEIELDAGDAQGIPTGLSRLDDAVVCGGLPKGQLSIVAGKQKHGKTPLMTQIAWRAATELGLNVVYALFSDLTPSQWKRRVIKLESGWGKEPDSASQREIYGKAVGSVSDPFVNLDIYDGCGSRQAGQVETFCSWLEAKALDTRIDLVCVDYAQVIGAAERIPSMYERMVYVGDYLNTQSRRMKDTAFVVGSQLSGDSSTGTRMRYGAEWEHHCGFMVEIDRDIHEKPESGSTLIPCELIIKYSRFGESGTTQAWWDTRKLKFISHGDENTSGLVWFREDEKRGRK